MLRVTDYEQLLGLATMPQANLLKLDRVQNEAMRVILGTNQGHTHCTETMRFMLDLPPVQTPDRTWSRSKHTSVL